MNHSNGLSIFLSIILFWSDSFVNYLVATEDGFISCNSWILLLDLLRDKEKKKHGWKVKKEALFCFVLLKGGLYVLFSERVSQGSAHPVGIPICSLYPSHVCIFIVLHEPLMGKSTYCMTCWQCLFFFSLCFVVHISISELQSQRGRTSTTKCLLC